MRLWFAVLFGVVALLSLESVTPSPVLAQALDAATETKVRVKFISAQRAYDERNFEAALDRLNEIDALVGGDPFPDWQVLKVKVLVELKRWEYARDALDLFYQLNPTELEINEIVAAAGEIDSYFAEVREKEEAERKEREAARLAEEAAWSLAERTKTEAAYKSYLEQYPVGRFAEAARRGERIAALPRLIGEEHAQWENLLGQSESDARELESKSAAQGREIFLEDIANQGGAWVEYQNRVAFIEESTALDKSACRQRLKRYNYVKGSAFGKFQSYFCKDIEIGRARIAQYIGANLEPLKALERSIEDADQTAAGHRSDGEVLCREFYQLEPSASNLVPMCDEWGVERPALPPAPLPVARAPAPTPEPTRGAPSASSSTLGFLLGDSSQGDQAPGPEPEEPASVNSFFGETPEVSEPSEPSLLAVPGVPLPASFCTLEERNNFHDRYYKPAAQAANRNNQIAIKYLQDLQRAYDEYDKLGKIDEKNRIAKKSQAYQPTADRAYRVSQEYANVMFERVMSVPVTECAAS